MPASAENRSLFARAREPFSGYSHLVGALLAAIGSFWLIPAAKDTGHAIVAATYVVCVIALFGSSSAYHLLDLGERMTARLRRLDHAAIFLMIAGSATPMAYHALAGQDRVFTVLGIWTTAVIGILFRTLWLGAPRLLYTATYVVAGWVPVFRWRAITAAIPHQTVALILVGGVLYTLGAIVYVLRWPNPRPKTFGFHEVWHLFVLGASAAHFAAVVTLT